MTFKPNHTTPIGTIRESLLNSDFERSTVQHAKRLDTDRSKSDYREPNEFVADRRTDIPKAFCRRLHSTGFGCVLVPENR